MSPTRGDEGGVFPISIAILPTTAQKIQTGETGMTIASLREQIGETTHGIEQGIIEETIVGATKGMTEETIEETIGIHQLGGIGTARGTADPPTKGETIPHMGRDVKTAIAQVATTETVVPMTAG